MRLSVVRILCAFSAMSAGLVSAAVPLPQLNIDKTQTTLSGLSAGGYMAVQMHVAYSDTFKKGAGVVAGGPYYCAEGSVFNATGRCMTSPSGIPVSTLVNTTNSWASQGLIDPVANLQNSRVYLFSGTLDSSVKPGVMDALKTYYNNFVPAANVAYKNNIAAEHAMVTDDYGSACTVKAAPYINNCSFDLAGALLQHLYGTLNPRNSGVLAAENFVEFNQSQFVSGHGMATTAWAYVPQSCKAGAGASCRLHVVLHGCKQNVNDVQQQFVRNTGYNRWADTNNMVMLYPQTSSAATNSCWDWWGYDSANYAKQSGPQMSAIKAMVDQLSSGAAMPPPVGLPAPTGVSTSSATPNSMTVNWNAVPGAASYDIYRNNNKSNALPVIATSFVDTGLAAATSYNWTVRAEDANGVVGAESTVATGTTAPTVTCYSASNYAHTVAGRAYAWFGFAYANGSDQYMGWWNIFSMNTLKMTGANFYVVGTCP